MKARNIYITVEDMTRLSEYVRVARARHQEDISYLNTLREELDRADVVLPERMPADIVTMHSQVLLRDLASGEETQYVIVFPENADILEGRISVVSPIGAAMLGRKVGDTIRVHAPAGTRRMRIERLLFQPEAAAMLSREACA
ncbi:MAG: nucleoside diphosphate kinase regulator [Phycisphaerae bacterium]|nr:nucleoside diphosphate kinase regulator [Phycisphaerae bacterium]